MTDKWLRTILCVDDEQGVLEAYRDVFSAFETNNAGVFLGRRQRSRALPRETPESHQFNLLLAQSGEDALELVQQYRDKKSHICAAFIDMKMPGGIDGLETIERLLEIDPLVNVAVVTAYTDRSIQQIGSLFEDQDRWIYFNKPFTRGELQQAAVNLTAAWNLRRERNKLLTRLQRNHTTLKQLIEDSSNLFKLQSNDDFYDSVLQEFCEVFCEMDVFYASVTSDNQLVFQAGLGKYKDFGSDPEFPPPQCANSISDGGLFVSDKVLSVPVYVDQKLIGLLYAENHKGSWKPEKDMLLLFSHQVAAAFQNLTMFHRVEELHREVSHLEQRKSQFIALASHELRTPLVTIKGYTDLLSDGEMGELTKSQKKAIITVKQNADRLTDITNQIIHIAKTDTGKMELDFQTHSLRKIFSLVLEDVSAFSEKRNLVITSSVQDDLPDLRLDGEAISKALFQLVMNAVKFTPDGGNINLLGSIDTGDGSTQKWVLIEVSDTGVGIPAEEHEKIFTRFYEVQAIEHHSSGTSHFLAGGAGLGLAIASNIVKAHEGHITVDSEEGQGSTFTIHLPFTA